jgi:nitrite reductase/ring-hydroxylating ferredoxin subunit
LSFNNIGLNMQEKPKTVESDSHQWIDICQVDDVFEDCGRRYELNGFEPLAVFNLAGTFQVTDDTCTHGNASLADGWVSDGEVECPFHSGKFCLKTGKATASPAEQSLKVYRTRVEAGRVQFDPIAIVPEE